MSLRSFLHKLIFVTLVLTCVFTCALYPLSKEVSFAFFTGSIVNICISSLIWHIYLKTLLLGKNYTMILFLSILKKISLTLVILILAIYMPHHLISGLSTIGGTALLPLITVIMGYHYSEPARECIWEK